MLSLDDIQELLGLEVLGLIPESKAVLTATNLGQPVIMAEGEAFFFALLRRFLTFFFSRFFSRHYAVVLCRHLPRFATPLLFQHTSSYTRGAPCTRRAAQDKDVSAAFAPE